MAVAELLYHTTLTVVDYNTDTSGSTQTVYVLGTHANLESAKQFAAKGLHSLGYEPEDFAIYEGHQPGLHWRHGDGVIIFAKSWNGQKLLVGLVTTPNNEGLLARPNGTIEMPKGTNHLHYVLQNKVDYNRDRSGAAQTTEIEGCYLRREDAIKAAKECLAQNKEEFDQYDEHQDLGPAAEWPFGEDVLVHAVGRTGENYSIAIRTPPDAHKKHRKGTSGVKQNNETEDS